MMAKFSLPVLSHSSQHLRVYLAFFHNWPIIHDGAETRKSCAFHFGDRLHTRQIDNQFNELTLKNAILNRMTHLGMPGNVKAAG
jgi:hypothetical protein